VNRPAVPNRVPRDDSGLPRDLQEQFRVDLCEHPLYPDLQQYVKANRR